jgi:shikimate kinase
VTPRAVLVGLPGVGKSTTGRRLAKILGVGFVDSDDLVEAADGRAVRTIFADSGESVFRSVEAAAIAEALENFDGVLALGGGALGAETTRVAVRESRVAVVMLRARLGTLAARVGDGRTRPLLAGDPENRLRELADKRGPVYAEVATFTVDTDGRTPGQVAATVAARLHEVGAI